MTAVTLGNNIIGVRIKNVEKFKIILTFENKSDREVDLSRYFQNPIGLAAEVIRGNMFSKLFLENGALAWPNGLEFCPDALWALSVPINNKISA